MNAGSAGHNSEVAARLLDRRAVRSVLRWPEVIDAVRGAYRAAAADRALRSAAAQVALPTGSLHLKAGGLVGPTQLSVKANLRPDNASASGVILLFDAERGVLRAVVDSADITAYRTAATAVVAATALGARQGSTVAVLGAGPVAAGVVRALPFELGVGEFHVWSRNPDRAHELARTAGVDVDIRVHDSPGAAAAKADVVVTCTPSREPLISAADLLDEALVVAMGADSPGKRELAGDVVEDAVVVVDDPVGALAVGEATHLAGHARQAVLGDLGSLLIGAITLPDLAGKRVVFDSVGVAYVDTAVAALVVAQAEAKGLGESFTFGDQGSA